MTEFFQTMNLAVVSILSLVPADLPTIPFESPKYGIQVQLPEAWELLAQEEDDLIFVAKVPQRDPERPGVVAGELALAPETLEEYQTRIDANAKQGRMPGELVRNEVVKDDEGNELRLETVREFRPPFGGTWRERTVRIVTNRQMYAFTFNVNIDDPTFDQASAAFDALLDSVEFQPPDSGADQTDPDRNRWTQREFNFAIDLPEDWSPVLAPSAVALLYANGPPEGIWSDNLLIIARPHQPIDLETLADELPDAIRAEDPNCEILACEMIDQGERKALETVVRTERGPFSMTVLERRFRGDRFDYEVKFTLESKRYDDLAPILRESLDSFEEVPGDVPLVEPGRAS